MRAIRTSKRLLRRWIALWLEDRRRARAATHVGPTVPNAPQNLVVSNIGTALQLDWLDMSADETLFRVYRKVDAGSYGLFQTLAANTTTYVDGSVVSGHTYSYYVTAVNAIGESAHSNEVSIFFTPS